MENYARDTANILVETKSVLFNADEPFVYTSGRISPVYIDCRRLISFPEERSRLMNYGAEIIKEKCGDLDIIAGGETAGIPYAAFIAERLNRPMVYIRKKPKGFGRMAQIEGVIEKDSPTGILVEDLQTDGGSKKVFIDAMREAGITVKHGFVVFHYGIFPQSEENMKNMGVELHALATLWDVLAVAKEKNYFDTKTLSAVEDFLQTPEGWAERHGKEDVKNSA